VASRGEVSINTGSAPEQRIRLWMIQEARERGVGVSNGSITFQNDTMVCVQTNVNFLLWQGEAEPIQYCECYTQADSGWQTSSVNENACQIP
jgi:hypothetical protein